MRMDLIHPYENESDSRLPRPSLTAILIGLGLGSFSTIAWLTITLVGQRGTNQAD